MTKSELQLLHSQIQNIFLGQDTVIKSVLAAFFAGGHVLLEGVPGVGKTLIALAMSQLFHLKFRRIQFTNDMLPSDVTGFHTFAKSSSEPELMKGPVFANIVLADEINRTSPKTQSALLEAMEEGNVTIDGITYELPRPFMVIATQNPIEVAGTFPLPESQLDRFLIKVEVGYPPEQAEREILLKDIDHTKALRLEPVMDTDRIMEISDEIKAVMIQDEVLDYITAIVRATRIHPQIELGASPRGGLALKRMAQAWAYLNVRNYVTPDDVRDVTPAVIAHRIITRNGAPRNALEGVLDEVAIPY